jgi:integrase
MALNFFLEHDNNLHKNYGGTLCMKGGIYSDEKCLVCGGRLSDNHLNALACPTHSKCKARSHVVRFGNITKRFKSYQEASRFLTGLRFKIDENTFDERDYRRDNPLGFMNLSAKWLECKKDEIKFRSWKNIENHIKLAATFFQDMNVKEIRYGNVEDFLKSIKGLSDKTKHNILSTLHSFFAWTKKRQDIAEMPDFPIVNFVLGYRHTIGKDVQWQILDEIKRLTYSMNPKIWLGVKWLTTYISIRPGELRTLTEGNIDLENGYLFFPHPKEKHYKSVPILKEDVDYIKEIGLSPFSAMPFFRHTQIYKQDAQLAEKQFGQHLFYDWWKTACKNLGIECVDLYGGTRHSSARALRKTRTPEEIKKATMHSTNKAFDRYFDIEADDVRSIYQDTAKVIKIDNGLITKNKQS